MACIPLNDAIGIEPRDWLNLLGLSAVRLLLTSPRLHWKIALTSSDKALKGISPNLKLCRSQAHRLRVRYS